MNRVKVAADKNGNIIGVSQNNPEYGYIRVEQVATQINDQGWLRNVKRSSLIKGKVEDLLACNYKEGSEILGKIVVVESFEPFNPVNPERDLKIAGDTGVICRVNDQPIYRQTLFTSNQNATDELITHNNADEIRDVQAAQRSLTTLVSKSKTEDVNL
jgi:hypothetical protein